MKYIEYLNGLIKAETLVAENCVLFGQNINAGSCLGGLTRNIKMHETGKIFNSTNAENSLAGFGFGLLMNGMSGVFLMKQLDFLLLSIDQLVNTYNIIRNINETYPGGSFTIVATVVDSGYEGPQSSFNGFSDLCSIARINGYTVTNKADADYLFSNHFIKPGFRIIAISQRLSKLNIDETMVPVRILNNGEIFQYKQGKDVTIVSFNFSNPQASKLATYLENNEVCASHFHVNAATGGNMDVIINDIGITKKVIIIDDSKSLQTPGDALLAQVCGMGIIKKIVLKRQFKKDWLNPVSDVFEIEVDEILKLIQVDE